MDGYGIGDYMTCIYDIYIYTTLHHYVPLNIIDLGLLFTLNHIKTPKSLDVKTYQIDIIEGRSTVTFKAPHIT